MPNNTTLLSEKFDSTKEVLSEDVFTSLVEDYVVENLNPRFTLREYQKEAIGRLRYYFENYPQRKRPAQLLFNMATGSGKTMIMAASIIYLYKKGYRNFIFFVDSTNIIEKTKHNFLNTASEKHLFNSKIVIDGNVIPIQQVDNFVESNSEAINIHFTTIQGLHSRLNNPRENSVTYEDFDDKEMVLLSDEAHHLNTLTKSQSRLLVSEKEELTSWEGTVQKIFSSNKHNILLEFTATVDWNEPAIVEKYQDNILYQYDLKQFRLDGYSKEIEVLQADLPPVERGLQAIIVSQYRRKVAEKHGVFLKPVVLFKANYVNPPSSSNPDAVVSSEFREALREKINSLQPDDITDLRKSENNIFSEALDYFNENEITLENLIDEIKIDFSEEKCISVDSSSEQEENQVLINTLEERNNQIRAIFAVDMLNEGWDVLNLFDIVRLYDTRDSKSGRPGRTTISEAQLIGRGARYYPFKWKGLQRDKRKFDNDVSHELRIVEQLNYHSAHNPRYIDELKTALKDIGIYPEHTVERELKIKETFKKTDFWKKGLIFLNKRKENPRKSVKSIKDYEVPSKYEVHIPSGEMTTGVVFSEDSNEVIEASLDAGKTTMLLLDLGSNVIREALYRNRFFTFSNLKKLFPSLSSAKLFIESPKYLGSMKVTVSSSKEKLSNLSQKDKLKVVLGALSKVEAALSERSIDYIGTEEFVSSPISEVFTDKVLRLDSDSERAQGMNGELSLHHEDWYAQNDNFGTSEEKAFLRFMMEVQENLREQYEEIAVLRNERFFQIYNFDDGQPFEPDFCLFLRKKNDNQVSVYQVFIEPKGDQFKDSDGRFDNSKEGWKQDFLRTIESRAQVQLSLENQDFRLLGLPFFNEELAQEFEEVFEQELM